MMVDEFLGGNKVLVLVEIQVLYFLLFSASEMVYAMIENVEMKKIYLQTLSQ